MFVEPGLSTNHSEVVLAFEPGLSTNHSEVVL